MRNEAVNHISSTITSLASLSGFPSHELLQSRLRSVKNLIINSTICVPALWIHSLLWGKNPHLFLLNPALMSCVWSSIGLVFKKCDDSILPQFLFGPGWKVLACRPVPQTEPSAHHVWWPSLNFSQLNYFLSETRKPEWHRVCKGWVSHGFM